MRTHYDNLYVGEKATPEIIKAAYKVLAQKWHPDKNPSQRAKAERYFKIINRAFEVLSDPEKRAAYDLWLSRQRNEKEDAPEPESERSYPESKTASDGSMPPRQSESDVLRESQVSAEIQEFQEGRQSKKIRDDDVWLLNLWTYLILPIPALFIVLTVLFDDSLPRASMFNMFNWQQFTFLAFSAFLVFGLHARWLLAWRLNWVAILAVAALSLHIIGYSWFAGAICGLWVWWSFSTWSRLKSLFMTIADWCQLQEQAGWSQEKPERIMHKPLKGKIWGGWKGFFYSFLFFIPVFMLSDEFDLLGALILSFFVAALVGAIFACVSDLEVAK